MQCFQILPLYSVTFTNTFNSIYYIKLDFCKQLINFNQHKIPIFIHHSTSPLWLGTCWFKIRTILVLYLFNAEQKNQKQNPAQDLNLLWDVSTSHIENTESETRWISSVQKQSQFTGPSSPSVSWWQIWLWQQTLCCGEVQMF